MTGTKLSARNFKMEVSSGGARRYYEQIMYYGCVAVAPEELLYFPLLKL